MRSRGIELTQGEIAIIDDDMYEKLSQFNWHVVRMGTARRPLLYAARNVKAEGKWRLEMMHRRILNAGKGMVVDHIDNNGLNNRIYNLRLCSQLENMKNLRSGPNKTGFRGVYVSGIDHFTASIRVNKKLIYLGHFAAAEQAAREYDRAAFKYFGQFAKPNFPI